MDAPELKQLKSDLSAYVDGELPPERRQQIERALADSAELRRLVTELQRVASSVAALPRVSAPGHLAAELAARAAEHLPRASSPAARGTRILRLRPVLRWSAVAAVLGLGVFISWRVLLEERHRRAAALHPAAERVAADRPAAPAPPQSPTDPGERVAQHEQVRAARGGSTAHAEPDGGEYMAKSARGAPPGLPPPQQIALAAPTPTNPAAPGVAADTAALGIGTESLDAAPAVEIVVRPRDAAAYARVAATLTDWEMSSALAAASAADPRPPAEDEALAPAADEPLVIGGSLAPDELSARIDALAQAVRDAAQVRVNLSFDAADSDALLVAAARGARGGRRPAAPQPEPALANEPTTQPQYFASRAAKGEFQAGGRAGAREAEGQPGAPSPATPAAAAPEAALGGRSAGKPPPPVPRRNFDDQRDPAQIRRDLAERHRAVTEEPELPPDLLPSRAAEGPGPESKSAALPHAAPVATTAPAATSVPAGAAGREPVQRENAAPATEVPRPEALVDRLLGLLFRGAPEPRESTPPAARIGYRVIVLPPQPPPATAPAGPAVPPQ